MKICFVIPAYNDEVSLKKLIENIKSELKKFTLYFIVVNDCSNDKFESLRNSSQIDLITLIKNPGLLEAAGNRISADGCAAIAHGEPCIGASQCPYGLRDFATKLLPARDLQCAANLFGAGHHIETKINAR